MLDTLVAQKNGFVGYFNCASQTYKVYKDGKFVIGGKHKFSQVKSYVE